MKRMIRIRRQGARARSRAARGSGRDIALVVNDLSVRAAAIRGRSVDLAVEPLEPGIVVQGEVVDGAALAAAISRLWSRARFGSRRVVIGLAGRDAVTRRLELPEMSDRDIRSALQYELADMLPFPPSDALLDMVRIETTVDESELSSVRVLAVAVHRECVGPLIEAARAAKLQPVRADMVSFGLVRFASVGGALLTGTRAVVHVGGSALFVVVHTEGVVRFTRRIAIAGETNDAADLEADLQFVERYRNRLPAERAAGTATLTRSDPLVSAIAGTIEYYTIQPGALPLSGIDLIADQERAAAVAESLEAVLGGGIAVRSLDQFGDAWSANDELSRYAPAIGLIMEPGEDVVGPEPLNLLPPAPPVPIRQVAVRSAFVGAAALAAGLGIVSQLGPDEAAATDEAEAAEATTASLQARLGALADERVASFELKQGELRVAAIQADRVPWEILIARIRASTPADTTLLSVTARAAEDTATGRVPGEIELTAQAPTNASASAWLSTLGELEGIRRPWLSAASTADEDGVAGLATFSITVELDDDFAELYESTPGSASAPEDGS